MTQAVTTGILYGYVLLSSLQEVVFTGFVCGLGDAIAQVFIDRRKFNRYDLYRTARMASIGFFFTVS